MADFKDLIRAIEAAINRLNAVIPGIQKRLLEDVLMLTKQLDTSGNNIQINTGNLKVLSGLSAKLQKIILNPEYVSSVKDYVRTFDEVTNLQNEYFKTLEAKYAPPKIGKEIMKLAKESVVNQLTEASIEANLVDGVKEILRKGITSGSSYAGVQEQLNNYLTDNDTGEGQLQKYTRQISTDAINQYSRQYSNLVSSDLGLEWFRYSGSNLKTTRPFCLACTERKYFHLSEVPKLLKGDFPEFEKYNGKIYEKTGLPQGMYPETDVSNFSVLLGGYNCGHQYRPCSEDLVPEGIRERVYAGTEYKVWKGADGLKDEKSEIKNEKGEKGEPKYIQDLDKKGQSLKLDVTGGLATALEDLLNRGRKVVTNYEKKQLISLNGLTEKKSIKGGGTLYATHKQTIMAHELLTIDKLLKIKKDVLFMPDSYFGKGKKFDVVVFKENSYFTADLKHISSKNPNTISQAISYGGTQGKNVIADVNNDVDFKVLADGLIQAASQNEKLKSVVLFYKNRSKTYYRNQLLSNKFRNTIYKDFFKN